MEPELKALSEGLAKDIQELKATVAEKVKQEVKGVVDPLITEKLDKLNAAIDAKHEAGEKLRQEMQAEINKLKLAGEQKADKNGVILTPEQVEYKRALNVYFRSGKGGKSEQLSELEEKAMSVSSNPDGGYFVTPDVTGRIVTKIFETSPLRPFASVQTITTDAFDGFTDLNEADAGWVTEAGSRTATTTPQIGKWTVPVHEMYANPGATQKLLDDASVDVEAWLAGKIADKMLRLENAAFVTGNGVGKPRGFASYTTAATADASRAWGTPEHVATGSNGSFGTDPNGVNKLISLFHAMKDHFIPGAAWYMNRTTLGALRTILESSTVGKYIFIPSFQAGLPDQFLGLPIRKMQDMATYTTTGALAICLANMAEAYQIVDRVGFRVLRDPFTNKPYVHFYTTRRVGGDVINFEALKFLYMA